MIDNCIFNNISAFVFFIGILIYTYFLYLDLDSKVEEGIRTKSETIWIWGLYILLFMGFFISIYCTNNNIKDDFEKFKNNFGNFSNKFDNEVIKNDKRHFIGKIYRDNYKNIKKNKGKYYVY